MLKSYQSAFVLSLMLALAHPGSADARPSSHSSSHSSSSRSSSSSSFKSGFSSQRSSSSPAPSYASSKSSATPASSGGFGSFGRRPASDTASSGASDGSAAPGRASGGFGSFGAGRPAPQKSDSALSQELGRKAAEENALRTLDARRQSQANAARDTRPVPGYEGGQGAQGQAAPGYVPPMGPQPQPPVVVRQDSGLGHVVAGAVLANAMRGAHANNGGYPGNYPGNYPGGYGNTGGRGGHGGGTSFLGLFMTLCVLALVAWGVYFLWRRLRRAREAKKPNYSFKGN